MFFLLAVESRLQTKEKEVEHTTGEPYVMTSSKEKFLYILQYLGFSALAWLMAFLKNSTITNYVVA